MFLSNRAPLDVTIGSETLQSVSKCRAPWKKHKNAKQMPAQFSSVRTASFREKLFLQNKSRPSFRLIGRGRSAKGCFCKTNAGRQTPSPIYGTINQ